jgi:glutathione synthase/RimK-type ligase-like ATP-grasp enzyme
LSFTIAIQPDDYPSTGDGRESSSARWAQLAAERGHSAREVDVFRFDVLDQLRGCDALMWRHIHMPSHRAVARRLLPVVEKELGLAVYPDQNTCWHYDDKIAQFYLLQAAGIPTPRTWVFWDLERAAEFCATAPYPLVFKLWAGAGSTNIALVENAAEARRHLLRLFGGGLRSFEKTRAGIAHWRQRLGQAARLFLSGDLPNPGWLWELHKDYALIQEFLPGNAFDTRVTVIGRRAFAFRRFNRPNDFRASGSGLIDWNPKEIDEQAVRLAFRVAERLRTQSIAIDCLRKDGQPVVGEISYTYASWAVRECPGHWERQGDSDTGPLVWREGPMWPEEAQMTDFLARLEARGLRGNP